MVTLADLLALKPSEKKHRGLVSTPREIAQQPETWRGTLELFQQERSCIESFLEENGVRGPLEQRPVVLLVGAGTSDYIGLALEALLRHQWGCEVLACPSTTLLTNMDDYVVPGRRYLWISFSRSGDSPEGVAVLNQACERYPEIAHMVVTCNAQAAMIGACSSARSARVLVLDDAVNDRSLVMTSSFTNMIIVGQCLAHIWSAEEYTAILETLVRSGEALLSSAEELARHCAKLQPGRVCFIGSGPLQAVAKESALKVLEMTAGRATTMSESVLGLRHGPMAALNTETLLVCFVSSDAKSALYACDLLREVKGKEISLEQIAIGPAASIAGAPGLQLAIEEGIGDLYRPVLDVLFAQLLGLFCSIGFGLQPDAPSPSGVISRVVGGVSIY